MSVDVAAVLYLSRRLRDLGATELPAPLSREQARDAIEHLVVAECICGRWPRVGGRLLTFRQFYAATFKVDFETGKPVKGAA